MAQVLKEEVKERILNAALEVFADKGYAAATMGEIAARAEISTGNTYHYYASKDALFRDVLDDAFVDRFKSLLHERVNSLSRRARTGDIEPLDAYQLASEELLRFTLENRLRMIILLGRAEGTRFEGFARETARDLVSLAITYVQTTQPTFVIPSTLTFTLERIYENLIATNVAILSLDKDDVRIREAYSSFNRYHLAGMRSLFT